MPGLEDCDYTALIEYVPANKTFMERRMESARRLHRLFGHVPPVDATVEEVRAGGLPVILASGVPLAYFMLSTLHQMCPENLFFYLEATGFGMRCFTSTADLQERATRVASAFLTRRSEFEINLDAEDHDEVIRRIRAGRSDCFQAAAEHVVRLMEPGYTAFVASPLFQLMCDRLANQAMPYSREVRKHTAESIVAYLDEHVPPPTVQGTAYDPNEPGAATGAQIRHSVHYVEPDQLSVTEMRNQMIRAMVHQFCRARLQMDFADTPERRRIVLAESAAAVGRMQAQCREELGIWSASRVGRAHGESGGTEMGMPHRTGPSGDAGTQRLIDETDYTRLIYPKRQVDDFLI